MLNSPNGRSPSSRPNPKGTMFLRNRKSAGRCPRRSGNECNSAFRRIHVQGWEPIIRIRNGCDWGLLCGQEGSLALLRLHPIPDRRAFPQLLLPLCWFLCQLPWRAFFLFSNRLLESSLRRLAYEATAPVRNSLRTKDRSRATKTLVASRIALSSPGIGVWWESR